MRCWFLLGLGACFSTEAFRNGGSLRGVDSSTQEGATPVNFVATPGDAAVTLTWDPIGDNIGYALYSSTSADFSDPVRFEPVTSPYLHDGLTNDTTYYYRLVGLFSDGESAVPATASATPEAHLPPTAHVLSGSAGDGNATLTWASHAKHSYVLSWNGGSLANATPPAVISGLANAVDYTFSLVATNAYGSSPASNAVTLRPLPPPPPQPQFNQDGASFNGASVTTTVFITQPAVGADTYRVYWQTTPGVDKATANVTNVPAAATTVQIIVPTCARVYYAATSVGLGGESAITEERQMQLCPHGCAEQTYYVDPAQGNDDGDGACYGFATLNRAMQGRIAGDQVILTQPGTYGTSGLTIPTGGKLIGLGADYTSIDATGVGSMAAITMQSDTELSGVYIYGHPAQSAVRVNGANAIISNATIQNANDGITGYGANLRIEQSFIFSNATGLRYSNDGLVLRGTRISRNFGYGVIVYAPWSMVTADLSGLNFNTNTVACNTAAATFTNQATTTNIQLLPYDDNGGTASKITLNIDGLVTDHGPPTGVGGPTACTAGIDICRGEPASGDVAGAVQHDGIHGGQRPSCP